MSKTCPNCGVPNQDRARFCGSCGKQLPQDIICPSCAQPNAPSARFCDECGKPLPVPAILGIGLLAPQSLLAGRYLIVEKEGQGGMGAVYKANDTRLGSRVVAVKEMSDAAITDPLEKLQARQAFEQEAQMLAQLSHQNLPRVTDHFTEGGNQYLVMDFVEGPTLEGILRKTPAPLDERQVVGWAMQLCNVLDYLHNQQPPVIFRDLKPSNIMLDHDGTVKLIDFGIARLFKPGKKTDTSSFGTAGYAPPEQYGQGQTDARSDIYALGATLHYLLSGQDPTLTPFRFAPIRSLNASISSGVEQAVMRAVEQVPAQRWQSAREMRDALSAPPPPPLPPPPPEPTIQQISVAGFVVTVVVAAAFFALLDWALYSVLGGSTLVRYALPTVWLGPGILAWVVARRPGAAFLSILLKQLILNPFLRGASLLPIASTLALAGAVEVVFALWRYKRINLGVCAVAAVAGIAALWAAAAVQYRYTPPMGWVIPQLILAPIGGAIVHSVGRVVRR